MTDKYNLSPDNSKKQIEEAEDFLKELLGTGPVKSDDVIGEATKHEISQRTLKRAKANLKVNSYPEPVKGKRGAGVWYWKLPDGIKDANNNTD